MKTYDQPEDYPGHNDERRRTDAIQAAVAAADRLIIDYSDGSTEETDFLTSAVALAFTQKIHASVIARMLMRAIRIPMLMQFVSAMPWTNKTPVPCVCGLLPSNAVHDPQFGHHEYKMGPHAFVEQCLRCNDVPQSSHMIKLVGAVGSTDHLWTAASDCKLCQKLKDDEIHVAKKLPIPDEPRRCTFPGCGSWRGAMKHSRKDLAIFDHDFQSDPDATEPTCWCNMPKLSTIHHPKHGTHAFGQTIKEPTDAN